MRIHTSTTKQTLTQTDRQQTRQTTQALTRNTDPCTHTHTFAFFGPPWRASSVNCCSGAAAGEPARARDSTNLGLLHGVLLGLLVGAFNFSASCMYSSSLKRCAFSAASFSSIRLCTSARATKRLACFSGVHVGSSGYCNSLCGRCGASTSQWLCQGMAMGTVPFMTCGANARCVPMPAAADTPTAANHTVATDAALPRD